MCNLLDYNKLFINIFIYMPFILTAAFGLNFFKFIQVIFYLPKYSFISLFLSLSFFYIYVCSYMVNLKLAEELYENIIINI